MSSIAPQPLAAAATSAGPLWTAERWRAAPAKRLALFGMSGVGKTWIAKRLRDTGDWFHYSIDYRIGTRYLGEHIVDDFKREAMRSPLLREMLLSDSIYISSNITFENLKPLASFLGKPGAVEQGGLPFDDYVARQRLHREAERRAMLDSMQFVEKATEIYGYDNFLCDTSGSLVEIVDPDDPADPLMTALAPEMLFVLIESAEEDDDELARRFDRDPKPMYYNESYLVDLWLGYQAETGFAADQVDPDAFVRWGFRRLIARRRAGYRALADRWGARIARSDLLDMIARSPAAAMDGEAFEAAFCETIAEALAARPASETHGEEAAV